MKVTVFSFFLQTNYKITAARLQNEIKSLQQRVNAGRLNLINEIKVISFDIIHDLWISFTYSHQRGKRKSTRRILNIYDQNFSGTYLICRIFKIAIDITVYHLNFFNQLKTVSIKF